MTEIDKEYLYSRVIINREDCIKTLEKVIEDRSLKERERCELVILADEFSAYFTVCELLMKKSY